MDTTDLLHRRIAQAAENLAAAEKELAAALAVTRSDQGPEKQMISSRLESAFERLAATRKTLEEALNEAG